MLSVTRFESVSAAAVAPLAAEQPQPCWCVWGKERKISHMLILNTGWLRTAADFHTAGDEGVEHSVG